MSVRRTITRLRHARRWPWAVPVLMLALVPLISSNIGGASIPDVAGVIHACYVDDGQLRVIDTAGVTGTCKALESSLSWSKEVSDDAVTSAKILDGTIATADLANDAVTLVKLRGPDGTASIDPASLGPNTCRVDTAPAPGIQVGDAVFVQAPAVLEAGLTAIASEATANTLSVRICNVTGAAIDGVALSWRYVALR